MKKNLLIPSITPYFLDKGGVWFTENIQEILKARTTQPFFKDNTLFIEQGANIQITELLRKLDEFGYEKVFSVKDPGEFSRLGGAIELFPICQKNAIRIEFFGNTIETITELNITTDEKTSNTILKKRLQSQKIFSDLAGIKPGDYLVHLDHGVARFCGMGNIQTPIPNDQLTPNSLNPEYSLPKQIQHETNQILNTPHQSPKEKEFPYGTDKLNAGQAKYYILEYAAGDTLYIPIGLERKLSRYVGFQDPKVSRLGSTIWIKTKTRIKEEVEKLARELLDLYAQREVVSRIPYGQAEELSQRIEQNFPYQETLDQTQVLKDIEKDLAKKEPMDRIVCGDVGFGKTEIALRAMVRAVEQGYQTAILAPTTILALQHYQNFIERTEGLPIHVALLSRLQNQKDETQTLKDITNGTIDIAVGTHRLLSSDVHFKNLGLLVIDDEQRFGVKQKEKLRTIRTTVDMLSLSATPIPRTLYMSLASLKGLSIMQTPPEGRIAPKVFVQKRATKIIQEAIKKELERKGQVYYLHNRIGTIELAKRELQKLAPKANITTVHGSMRDKELVRVMRQFKNKEYDILVATTIIENGIDLPNVNTLIVEDATKLGLAQAYQIRGRVGRSRHQSYAYFLYGSRLKDKAKLRLEALAESEALGSGYKIALRDMEIRGAGNLLGKEQSGSVNAIGLNLYCQMLGEAVERNKTAKPAP